MTPRAAVDVHTHLAPDLDLINTPHTEVAEVDGRYVVDGHRVGLPALYDAPRLAGWLRGVSLDQVWVSLPPPLFRVGLEEASASRWVMAANDGLLTRIDGYEELTTLAYLPLDQPGVAVSELARLSGHPRVTGWAAAAGGGTLALDDPALERVWAAVEESDRPVLLHPGASPDPRLDPHYLSNLLGNPVETTVAAAQMVFGDVLARHPGLRPVLVHCGGAVPTLVGRWQRGVDTVRPGIGPLCMQPREAVRRFYCDALAHDSDVVDLALAVLGADRLLLGSDWPFPMGLDDPSSAVAHLAPEVRDQITRANPHALRGATS